MCGMNCNSVLVLCWCQEDIVFRWLLLLTVDVKFLESWKGWVLANNSVSDVGGVDLWAWNVLIKCRWCVFLLDFTIKFENHHVERFECLSLKVVSHGDFAGSLPWRLKHYKSNLRVLKWLNWVMFETVHCWGCWNESACVWKCLGSWNESICDILQCTLLHMVLKWVNFDEMSQNAVQVVHKFLTKFSKKFSAYVEGLDDFLSADLSF